MMILDLIWWQADMGAASCLWFVSARHWRVRCWTVAV